MCSYMVIHAANYIVVFTPDFYENTILRYELAMMARTCTNNLRVVLSP